MRVRLGSRAAPTPMRRGAVVLLFVCVTAALALWALWNTTKDAPLEYRSHKLRVRRLRNVRAFLAQRRSASWAELASPLDAGAWIDDEVTAPDVNDRTTLLMLARMSCLAYYRTVPRAVHGAAGWEWSSAFGWEAGGLRGHVFATENNATIVVALKGTSASFLPGGDTGQRDKDNVRRTNVPYNRTTCCSRAAVGA